MNIFEVIKLLQKLKKKYGDIDVLYYDSDWRVNYELENTNFVYDEDIKKIVIMEE